ncbi:hypothetical protein Tco_1173203 [Tanacetum coccineum]
MKSFRLLQSHLQVLSYNDLKINGCLEREFAILFEQDVQTFTGIILLNLDQLEKKLDKDEFQGDRSMAAFCVINKQFQMFIDTQLTWDYDSQMTEKHFAEYTGIEVKQFRETLLLHMGNVKKSLAERARHKRQYDRRMNERQMQSRESEVVSSKALDTSLAVTECSGTKSDKHDTSSSSRTYITHAVDVDNRPVKDKEPMAEVQLTAAQNVLANEQQHTDQSKPSYDTYLLEKVDSNTTPNSTNMCHRGGEIDQDAEQYQAKSPLLKAELVKSKEMIEKETYNELSRSVKEASNEAKVKHEIDVLETINIELESSVAKLLAENEKLNKENEHLKQTYKELYDSIKKTRIQTKDHNDSLIAQVNSKTVENADLKAQIQEKVFANVALKNELRKLKGNSVDTKFAKPSILGKPVLQPPRNQSVVRQPNAFKSERPNFSKPRFASQVDVNNVLSKPVTPHYLPKVREYVLAKPHHVIAPGSFRNSQEEPYGSNDMAHNHYLEEARKKTQERNRNSKPSVMHTTSLQNTTNGSKPNPRSNNQISRSLPVSKSSCGMSNGVSLVDHSRNSSSFSDSKHFVCSMCHKCVFNANHDNCITKFLKEVNSCVKVQSPKTRNINKPVEPKSHTQKPGRQIAKGQRFSPKKSSAVHEKPNTPRSCLRWKPTGRIFKIAGLRWIPTGKMFTDNTTKVDSEPSNGSNDDITNSYECDQTLNVSAGLALQRQNDMASADNTSGPAPQRKERCTLQCTLSLEEEKSSYLRNGSNDVITNSYECDQTLNVSAGTTNLSADDVCSHQFRPYSSSIDNVCSCQFRPRSSMIDDVCSHQFRPHSSSIDNVCSRQFRPRSSTIDDMTSVHISSGLALQRQMASADNTSGPAPQRKERCTLQCTLSLEEEKSSYLRAVLSTTSIRLVQNLVSSTPYVLPSKKDYEILFQPLFDEYFNPPPRAVSLDPVAVAAQELLIQSVQLRQLPLIKMYHLLVPHQQIRKFNLKSFFKLTKNHPLENVIGDPSRSVLTRSLPQEHAIWSYFDANDNSIPFDGKRSGRVLLSQRKNNGGSSEGSGTTPEVPDEPKDNSAVVAEKQVGYVQTNLTLSSVELEIQSMVDVRIHQEELVVQRTLLIDPVILMVTKKTTSTPTPPTTQAHVQMCSTSCWKDISRGV